MRPGDLYAALPGTRVHGAEFSAAAVAAGATAILTDPAGRDRAAAAGVPVFVIADPRARLGEVACWVYGDPSRRLRLIGVTGTSGKTTTSYLTEAGLRRAGHVTGLIGGVETRIGADVAASELTTPEATDLQALLATMAERGVTAAAMEVSSHALALGRVAGTHYDVADLHQPVAGPPRLPRRSRGLLRGQGQLCSPRSTPPRGWSTWTTPTVSGSRRPRLSPSSRSPRPASREADWRAENVRVGADGSAFRVIGPGGVEADASLALVGPFNVANALGAIVALVEAGTGLEDAVAGVGSCPGVPGRLERVDAGGAAPDLTVLVDYSHKPGAVEAVLGALRPVTQGSLIIVLGCGGDRDRAKRPLMGAAAASARRRGHLHQRQPAVRGSPGHPRGDAGRRARACRSGAVRT